MRADAVLVIRSLTVREYTLLVDGEPQSVTQSGDCLCHALNLLVCRRLRAKAVGICIDTAEDADVDAPTVAVIGRGKHVVEFTVCDNVDFPVLVDLPLPGTIPNSGFSYMDERGETHTFALKESGWDGSLFLEEIEPGGRWEDFGMLYEGYASSIPRGEL